MLKNLLRALNVVITILKMCKKHMKLRYILINSWYSRAAWHTTHQNSQWQVAIFFSSRFQWSAGAVLLQALGWLRLGQDCGVQICFMCVCSPWTRGYLGDVFMANEWQVHQSPAKSCNGLKFSTCVTSTHIPLPKQVMWPSHWDRERHFAHSRRGGEWIFFKQYSSLSQSVCGSS